MDAKGLLRLWAVLALAALAGCASMQKDRQHLVVQISDDNPKNWQTAFNVVNNVKQVYGKDNVDVEIVAFGDGINALTFDSKAAARISGAVDKGAKVIACRNSMKRFKLAEKDMAPDVAYVQAGVLRIMERQKEGWAVIRP